jgi:hypothetical protein
MRSLVTRADHAAATADRTGSSGERLRVPWSTVLPLAVVAALGNEFWLIAMRGAVGAIERSQGPFVVWLLESTLLLPLYVFAVLAAVTAALRWFGPGPLRFRAVAATLLVAALASTLAGVAAQATNAVHDYRLQVTHVSNMALHMPTCDAVCVSDREQSALLLQLNALGLNGLMMFGSTVVLLALVVALRGGRLDLAALRPESVRAPRFDRIELFLLISLLGTAAVHGTLIREQLARSPLTGIALLLLTIAEVDAALLYWLRLRRAQFLATAAVSAAPLLAWLGTGGANRPGLTDAVTVLLEAVTLLAAVASLRSRTSRGSAEHPVTTAVAGVVAVTVAGVAVGLGLLGGEQATRLQQGEHIHAAATVGTGVTPGREP